MQDFLDDYVKLAKNIKSDELPRENNGVPGEYIDQGIVKPAFENSFTSVGSFTRVLLSDMIQKEKVQEKQSAKS